VISVRLVRAFVAAVVDEIGAHNLPTVLEKTGLKPEDLEYLESTSAADVYARLQQALRLFYGRGARGMLLRIGRSTWNRLAAQASLREKAELEIVRRLPIPARRRRVLGLVAARLQEGGGNASIHNLDLDLLLVDHSGAATLGQNESETICYVTLGLIQEALLWATGQEADVDEIKCKAAGAPACEFRVRLGGM
jgi:predicted hydrocarbon binding protein